MRSFCSLLDTPKEAEEVPDPPDFVVDIDADMDADIGDGADSGADACCCSTLLLASRSSWANCLT
jgi:hypothetical protein